MRVTVDFACAVVRGTRPTREGCPALAVRAVRTGCERQRARGCARGGDDSRPGRTGARRNACGTLTARCGGAGARVRAGRRGNGPRSARGSRALAVRWALAAQVRREAVEMRGSGAAVLDVEPRGSERGRGVAGHAVGRDDHALRVGGVLEAALASAAGARLGNANAMG